MRTKPNPQRPATCPECGGQQVLAMNCWEQLGGILAWEWHDPELAAVHFLTVAAYNLQHPAQFTEDALAALRRHFIDHLDNHVPVEVLRRRMGRSAAGHQRVLRPEAARQIVLRRWPMTVADVYLPDQPAGAATRVRQWAAAIRREL